MAGFIPFLGVYSASKFALEALAESYRYDLASFGVDSVLIEPGAYPTPVWGKLAQPDVWGPVAQPADRSRVAEYGEIAEIPTQMGASVLEMFAGPEAPNPQEVVDVVAKLIETPAGERPLRTVVGQGGPEFALRVNDAAEQAQADLMAMLGLTHLMKL
ncbi:MAG: SDR family NAD(P)-dependent oxidoreductase [Candidatus Tectomicrobia bacterium]|nr:SDR family NAD(P)-dependent oxidoreductase [Candidatus Tectomicrobia bacterium]